MESRKLRFGGILVLLLPTLLINYFSAKPLFRFNNKDETRLVLDIKTITRKSHVCDDKEVALFLKEEAKKERTHLRRRASACGSRDRVPLKILLKIDDKVWLKKEYKPTGLQNDGNVFVYERLKLRSGIHRIEAVMDIGKTEGMANPHIKQSINFKGLSIAVLSYDEADRKFFFVSQSE